MSDHAPRLWIQICRFHDICWGLTAHGFPGHQPYNVRGLYTYFEGFPPLKLGWPSPNIRSFFPPHMLLNLFRAWSRTNLQVIMTKVDRLAMTQKPRRPWSFWAPGDTIQHEIVLSPWKNLCPFWLALGLFKLLNYRFCAVLLQIMIDNILVYYFPYLKYHLTSLHVTTIHPYLWEEWSGLDWVVVFRNDDLRR